MRGGQWAERCPRVSAEVIDVVDSAKQTVAANVFVRLSVRRALVESLQGIDFKACGHLLYCPPRVSASTAPDTLPSKEGSVRLSGKYKNTRCDPVILNAKRANTRSLSRRGIDDQVPHRSQRRVYEPCARLHDRSCAALMWRR